MIQFYKPNSKNTGSACSFWLSPKDNRFYGCIIKQDSWNAAKRTGSFSQNTENPDKKVIVKFSDVEIGGILDAIDNNRGFSAYHDGATTQFSTSIKFESYIREGKQVGYSFMVTKSSKEDSTKKNSFVIGLSFAEARILKENLIFLLAKSFASELSAIAQKSKNTEPSAPQQSQPIEAVAAAEIEV
jgi:Whirly transcription factor